MALPGAGLSAPNIHERRVRRRKAASCLVFMVILLVTVVSLSLGGLHEREESLRTLRMFATTTALKETERLDPLGLLKDHDPTIASLWTCSDPAPIHRKLIFVHVFKTAGSTFRYFFSQYGDLCKRGVAVIIGCSHMASHSLSGIWANKKGKGCECKTAWNRDHEDVACNAERNVSHSFMEKNGIDIMIGHFPIGVDHGWRDGGRRVQAQYVTFFRHPLDKFVSGRLFVNRDKWWSHDEAVANIKRQTRKRHGMGETQEGYSKYLLTPEQRESKPSAEEAVKLAMKNLVDFNVLIGVVERMGDSLELLGHVIDKDNELEDIMATLDPTRESEKEENENGELIHPWLHIPWLHGKRSSTVVRNKSMLSTSALVSELKEDEDFMSILRDYLRLEFPLYDFALGLHERQVEWLRRDKTTN